MILLKFEILEFLYALVVQNKFIGDKEFLAPEIVRKRTYNKMVDIYSLGLVLHYLIYNKKFKAGKSFSSKDRDNAYELVRRKGISKELHGIKV